MYDIQALLHSCWFFPHCIHISLEFLLPGLVHHLRSYEIDFLSQMMRDLRADFSLFLHSLIGQIAFECELWTRGYSRTWGYSTGRKEVSMLLKLTFLSLNPVAVAAHKHTGPEDSWGFTGHSHTLGACPSLHWFRAYAFGFSFWRFICLAELTHALKKAHPPQPRHCHLILGKALELPKPFFSPLKYR